MKKRIILCMLFLLGMVLMPSDKVLADSITYTNTEGTLTYTLDTESKQAVVKGNDPTAVSLIIQEKIPYNGETYIVRSIAEYSFQNYVNLQEITIPDSVWQVDAGAFKGCTSLQEVDWPQSTNGIRSNMFEDCTSLEKVTDISKVSYIGINAFKGCTKLKSIELPDGLESISWGAFWQSGIENIVMPDSVTSMGVGAFEKCADLQSVRLSDNITEIQTSTFEDCTVLRKINIPKKIQKIGVNAFKGCSSLSTVELPEGLEKIENGAFGSCSALCGEITIPASVTTMEKYVFESCSQLNSVIFKNTIAELPESTFEKCTNLTKVVLPDAMTTIGKRAFASCKNLRDIKWPGKLQTIGDYAFFACRAIKELVVPDSVNVIGEWAFNNSSNIEKVYIPANVNSVGENAFASCKNLKKLYIAEGVTNMGEFAFAGCDKLESVTLPGSMKTISRYLFNRCSGLKEVTILSGTTTLEDGAFANCESLESIDIPASVTDIASSFLGCSDLKNVALPENIRSLGADVFSNCPEAVVYYPKSFQDQLEGNTISQTIMEISYIINDDGTVALTVERNGRPSGNGANISMGSIELPKRISGRRISSITYSEDMGIMFVTCAEHYITKWHTITKDAHIGYCSVCKEDIDVAHDFGKGACAECEYIPFTLSDTKQDITFEEGYAVGTTFNVKVTPKLGNETIEYQWYENDTLIAGATANSYTIPTGKGAGAYTYYCKVNCNGYSVDSNRSTVTVTAKAKVEDTTQTGNVTQTGNTTQVGDITLVDPKQVTPKSGDCFVDASNKMIYKVITGSPKATVMFVKTTAMDKKASIPAIVTAGGITYQVVEIVDNAFSNNKNLTSVVIGKNVRKIGKKAFYGCKKLKNITIQTKKLTNKKVGSKAFGKIHPKATFKLPKAKYKAYRSMLKKKGPGKKVTYKKFK